MTQPAEVTTTTDVVVAPITEGETAPETTEEVTAPEKPSPRDELSALAKAEKAKWRERRALKAERQGLTARHAQYETQLRAQHAELERARNNTLEYAEERGITIQQLAARVVSRGTPEGEVESIKAELERLKAESAEARRQAQESQYTSTMRAREDEFHAIVASDEDAYPTLSAMPRSRVIKLAHELAREAREDADRRGDTNFRVDPKKLAAHLEKQESEIYGRAKGKSAGKQKDVAEATLGASNDTGRPGTKQAAPRTLTNAGATERGSLPVNFDDLSDKEQNKLLAQRLKEGWRG